MSFTWATIGQNVDKIKTWNPLKSEQLTTFKYIDLGSLDKDKKEICLDLVQEISSSEAPSRARQLVKTGDVLISTVRPNLNGIAVVPKELDGATASTGFCVLRSNEEKLDSTYLRYWVESTTFVSDMVNKSTGASYPAVSDKIINDSELPLPPLETQKQIAAVLEKADQLRKDCKLLEQELNSLAQSVFIEMFGDPVTNPKGWNLTYLPSHGSFKNGLNFTKDDSGISLKYLGVGDFKSLSTIRKLDNLGFVDVNSLPADDYLLKNGDLVFVRSNGNKALVGRCISIYPEDVAITFSGFCIRYRVESDSIEPEWLNYMLRAPSMKKALLEGGQGANIQNINQKILSSLGIPLPPIDMQRLFCKTIACYRESSHQLDEYSREIDHLFNALMQKAFSGELNLVNAKT